MSRLSKLLILLVGFLLAVPGFLVRANTTQDGVPLMGACIPAAAMTAATGYVLYISHWAICSEISVGIRWIAFLVLCTFLPLATESVRHVLAASVAGLLTALAAGLFTRGTRNRRWTAVVIIAAACAADATSLALGAGLAGGTLFTRREWTWGLAVLAAGAIGVGISVVFGAPVFNGLRMTGAVHAFDRDMMLVLAPILLNLAGWTLVCLRKRSNFELDVLSSCTIAGLIAFAAGLLGAPVTLSITLLPLWSWLPWGMRGLAKPDMGGRSASPDRLIIACTTILLVALSLPTLSQWANDAITTLMFLWPESISAR